MTPIEPAGAAVDAAELGVATIVLWIRLGVEAVGAATIGGGVVLAVARFLKPPWRADAARHDAVRITLARYLTLALELQLAADILSTAVAPTWDKIGKLVAIAAIRTVMNFFLAREVRELRATERATEDATLAAGAAAAP